MMKKMVGGVLILALLWAIVMTINKENTFSIDSKNVEEASQINFKRPSFTLEGLDSKNYSTDKIKNHW
ncbi:MAG: hypothetical protein ABF649_16630 [Bacillus sp. (in: firmicutes)]